MKISGAERVLAYRAHPNAEALLAILEGCKDRVYNVCCQVLRHTQDAEDAAQEALIKIGRDLGTLTDLQQFDSWIYRTAFNTALDALKRRRRRGAHEKRRALMVESAPPPDEAFEAVHEALGELDDESRCEVIQHYFERRTLEEMGRERGLSTATVWKRIENAKVVLRKSLARSGLTAFVPHVDGVLDLAQPASAPAGLVSPAVFARAARALTKSSPGIVGSVGGIAMTAKGLSTALVVALILLLGGAALIRIPHSSAGRENLSSTSKGASPPVVASLTPSSAATSKESETPPSERRDAFLGQLRSLAQLVRDTTSVHGQGKEVEDLNRDRAYRRHTLWRALRSQAYDDPTTFFAFLRAEENKDILHEFWGLIADTYAGEGPQLRYPKLFVEGLADLIADRLDAKDQTAGMFVRGGLFVVGGAQEAIFERVIRRLPSARDPDLLREMLMILENDNGVQRPFNGPSGMAVLEGRLDLLNEAWRNNSSPESRWWCLRTLLQTSTQAGEVIFREKLDEVGREGDPKLKQSVPGILENLIQNLQQNCEANGQDFAGRVGPGVEDRYVRHLKSALSMTRESSMWLNYASVSLLLPQSKATAVLEEARDSAPNTDSRAAVERVLGLIREGETKVGVLRGALAKSADKK